VNYGASKIDLHLLKVAESEFQLYTFETLTFQLEGDVLPIN